MKNKHFSLVMGTCVMLMTCCVNLQADNIKTGTERLITTNPLTQVTDCGWPSAFALDGDNVVWIDERNGSQGQQVFGVDLTDVNLDEFLIDDAGGDIYKITLSDTMAFYPVEPYTESDDHYFLRLADITDPNAVRLYDLDPNGADGALGDLDISGSLVAYSTLNTKTWQFSLIAADITDPNHVVQHVIYGPTYNDIYTLTLDGAYLCWAGWDDTESKNVLRVADISDLTDPNIQTFVFPDDAYLSSLDSSGDWLVAQGNYPDSDTYGLFGVQYYWNVENFSIEKIWETPTRGEVDMGPPRIDHGKVVWTFSDYVPSVSGDDHYSQSKYLYLANLLPPGPGPVSELIKTTESDPNQVYGADISGDTIVWSYYSNDDYLTRLHSAELEMSCGDWGYLPADLNRDCLVNLLDFAKFAESWLYCTDPNKPGCLYGVFNN